jgi:hypothetical protein
VNKLYFAVISVALMLAAAGISVLIQRQSATITPKTSTQSAKPYTLTPGISVTAPIPDQIVASPLTISGSAYVTNKTVYYRLKDKTGKVLASDNVKTNVKDDTSYGDFKADLTFSKPATDTGTVEIYEIGKDGTEQNKISLPVKFK